MRLNSDQCIEAYFKNKSTLIKSYFEENGIKAVVVGASGGIDSAVVASMLTKMNIEVIKSGAEQREWRRGSASRQT